MHQPGQKCIVQNVNTIDLVAVNGSTATVQSFLKQRGEPAIYYCTVEGYNGVFSFFENELKSLQPVTRKQRSDAGKPRGDASDLA